MKPLNEERKIARCIRVPIDDYTDDVLRMEAAKLRTKKAVLIRRLIYEKYGKPPAERVWAALAS